jgi:hypothetical protein
MAVAADQTLKIKLVAFYAGEKGGEYHFVGATVSPNGTIGPRTSPSRRIKTARRRTQHVLFLRRLHRDERFVRGHRNPNRRPCCRQNPDRFRRRRLSGRPQSPSNEPPPVDASNEAANGYLRWLEIVARDEIAVSWPLIERVASALVERHTLTAAEIVDILQRNDEVPQDRRTRLED